MKNTLKTGLGAGRADVRLTLSISEEVLFMGFGVDVYTQTLQALHQHNRHAKEGAFLAVGFLHLAGKPVDQKGRGHQHFWADIDIFGSEEAINRFQNSKCVQNYVKRRIMTAEKRSFEELGSEGTAFMRDRKPERLTSSFAARQDRRLHKNGENDESRQVLRRRKTTAHQKPAFGYFITSKGFSVFFNPVLGDAVKDFWVTTYGLSNKDKPCFLPCSNNDALRDMSCLMSDLEEI